MTKQKTIPQLETEKAENCSGRAEIATAGRKK